MKAKSSHRGHCQVCGSKQKLPAGLLSLHGYTTRWGFFSGICNGANHLPFEQDTSLIEGMIAWANREAARLRSEADQVREERDPEKAWYHHYVSASVRGEYSGYQWIQTRIFKGERSELMFDAPAENGQPARPKSLRSGFGLVEEYVRESNGRRSGYLEREAGERDKYAAWQAARIKDWKPAELEPIQVEAMR